MTCELIVSSSLMDKLEGSVYKEACTTALEFVGEELKNECENTCPVDTGNLRDSHELNKDDMSVTLSNTAEYCGYVIYGTSRMPAQPYPDEVISNVDVNELFNSELMDSLGW